MAAGSTVQVVQDLEEEGCGNVDEYLDLPALGPTLSPIKYVQLAIFFALCP